MSDEEVGYCQVGSSVVETTKKVCDEIHGNWTEKEPTVCVVATAALESTAQAPSIGDLRMVRNRVIERDPTAARLAEKYQAEYVRVAAPIVGLMHQDPVVREIVSAIAVQPAAQFLRVAAVSSTPGMDDGAVRAVVDEGVQGLIDNLIALGGGEERGEEFAETVLTTLREVLGSPSAETA